MTIVLCSKGYTIKYKKNVLIPNLLKLKHDKSFKIYHAGTKILNNEVYAIGGRVLNFVSVSNSYKKCRNQVIKKNKRIKLEKWIFQKRYRI